MTLKNVLILIAAILTVHVIGSFFDVYNLYPSFDMPMHYAGGLAMGLLASVFNRKLISAKQSFWNKLVFIIGFVLVIGLLWEYAEYAADKMIGEVLNWAPMTLRDTLGDLVLDTIGGITAFMYIRNK